MTFYGPLLRLLLVQKSLSFSFVNTISKLFILFFFFVWLFFQVPERSRRNTLSMICWTKQSFRSFPAFLYASLTSFRFSLFSQEPDQNSESERNFFLITIHFVKEKLHNVGKIVFLHSQTFFFIYFYCTVLIMVNFTTIIKFIVILCPSFFLIEIHKKLALVQLLCWSLHAQLIKSVHIFMKSHNRIWISSKFLHW